MSHKQTLLNKLATRQAHIGVIGVGYTGLPLGIAFTDVGLQVTMIDIDRRKVEMLNRGVSYIEDVPSADVSAALTTGKLAASFDYAALQDADAVIICVPTPLQDDKDPDMSYVIQAVRDVAKIASAGMLVVLQSTAYPGT
ncbi:MAG: NAD(P)-binding domain-containing protein, partial [Aggregatilineales bacterium]